MNTLSYKTAFVNKETVQKNWIVVDATDQVLGRLSARIAIILMGKHKASYTPHVDCGDNVIVIYADKVRLTGKKWTDRLHFRHSGYPGGQKQESPETLYKRNPTKLVEEAVRRMLPKTRLGRQMFTNLHVFAGGEHPHQAQNPLTIDINTIK